MRYPVQSLIGRNPKPKRETLNPRTPCIVWHMRQNESVREGGFVGQGAPVRTPFCIQCALLHQHPVRTLFASGAHSSKLPGF